MPNNVVRSMVLICAIYAIGVPILSYTYGSYIFLYPYIIVSMLGTIIYIYIYIYLFIYVYIYYYNICIEKYIGSIYMYLL